MYQSGQIRLAIAPMMDWTDRFCRYFHRRLTRRALLYTEMVVADAVIHGDRARLLGFHPAEHPVALQLGGSDPGKLAVAARIGAELGYDEINLNVGCPSDRVRAGAFGACLMQEPDLVGDCVAAMKDAVNVPVTVKCRLGVDEQDPELALRRMAGATIRAGVDALWVHARKAWLQGLSPKENRNVPPLDYPLVYRLKRENPQLFIGLNGGIDSLRAAAGHLRHVDGVMLGRAAYQMPGMLAAVDAEIHGQADRPADLRQVVEDMADHAARHIAAGGRLHHVTRHMTGLFHGHPGARAFRRMLAEQGAQPHAGADVLRAAAALVREAEPETIAG